MPVPHCTTRTVDDTAAPRPRRLRPERSAAARLVLAVLASGVLTCLLAAPAPAEEASPSSTTVEETTTVTTPGQPEPATTTTTTTTTTRSTPAQTASPEPATLGSDNNAVCDAAQELTDAGRPAEALALIDKVRASPDGADAAAKAAAARLCTAERESALSMQSEGPAGTSGDLERGWAAFSGAWLQPLLPSVLAAVGAILLTFVIAVRAATLLPLPNPGMRSDATQRGLAFASGGALVGALLIALISIGHLGVDARTARQLELVLPLLLGFLAALLLAVIFAAAHLIGRKRISVSATDKDGDRDLSAARTTQLVAVLGRFGNSPPAGLETPRGSDVSSLADSFLLPAPANAMAKAALAVLSALVGSAPWKVDLQFTGEHSASVVISRNGRTVQTAVLRTPSDPSEHGLFGENDAEAERSMLCALAAGVVVIALSRAHPGFEGLGGATDGRSVGLQFVATTTFAHDTDRAVLLLSRALQIDPGNRGADIALQHLLHRRSNDPLILRRYRDSLRARAESMRDQPEHRLLTQRVLMTYFSVLINLHSARPSERAPRDLGRRFRQMSTLLERAEVDDRVREQDPLLLTTKTRFENLREAVLAEYGVREQDLVRDDCTGAPPPWQPLDPYGSYNAALSALGEDKAGEAAFRLRSAFTSLELRRWIRQDPEVSNLRGGAVVDGLVGGGDRLGLWDLPIYAPHRLILTRLGFEDPLALTTATGDGLKEELGVTAVELARMTATAGLLSRVMAATPPSLAGPIHLEHWRVDLAEILVAQGRSDPGSETVALVTAELLRRMPPLSSKKFRARLACAVEKWLIALQPVTTPGPDRRIRPPCIDRWGR
ncbi:hypothetical protein EDF22_3373 [Rathayibacter sp. PhB127]|nr:hypothetical protein EDF22_3373 [Rathayibacter sp. PhB127]